jgi:Na+/proline symporter
VASRQLFLLNGVRITIESLTLGLQTKNIAIVHTVIIFVIMLSSMFVMYSTSEHVGSPGRMWELLKAAAEVRPVDGNAGGEFLTMRSVQGGLIGLIFLGGGFSATVDSQ